MFSRVILTRVNVLRMLYTFCIHDAGHAILIIIIILDTLHPKLDNVCMYVCVRVRVCMYVRTCTRIVERRALLVTFQRQRRVVRRFYSGDDSALGASTSTPQFIANYFQTRYLFSRPE